MSLPLPLGVAQDAAEVLVLTGRAVPPQAWVDRFVSETVEGKRAALPHNLRV